MPGAGEIGQGVAQQGGIGELLLARRDDDEQSLGWSPARQVRHQAQRQLVGPVQVLEYNEHRIAGRQARHQLGNRLEQTPVIDLGRQRRRVRDLGQQTSELNAPGWIERIEDFVVVVELRHPQRVDDRTEQENLVALVRSAQEHVRVAPMRVGDQLLDQAGLADARLAEDREEPTVADEGSIERVAKADHLGLAPDQRSLRRPGLRSPAYPHQVRHDDGAAGRRWRICRHSSLVSTSGSTPSSRCTTFTHS